MAQTDFAVPRPLGLFGARPSKFAALRAALAEAAGAVPAHERALAAGYLRRGAIVFAIMEQTVDLMDGLFTVAGGSAVCTDGVFYWRRDAAEYVEHYGIGLPAEFLAHARRLDWKAPGLSSEQLRRIDAALHAEMQRQAASDANGPGTDDSSG